jgi:hypothetical protein
MELTVKLTQSNGHYVASLLGEPETRVEAPTREAALDAIRQKVEEGVGRTEFVSIRVGEHPVRAMAGILKDDPTLEDFLRDVYRERDEQRIREHGE